MVIPMAARQWTESQKARQRALIQTWQPWKLSTGAKTPEGKTKVSRNALKTGEYTAAARQEHREFRAMIKEHNQIFKDLIKATQEYLDLANEDIFSK